MGPRCSFACFASLLFLHISICHKITVDEIMRSPNATEKAKKKQQCVCFFCSSGASFTSTLERLLRYLKSQWRAFSRSWQTGAFWETSWKRCRSTLPLLARYETNTHNACLPAWLPSDFLRSGWERATWHKHNQNSTFTHISKSCLF